MRTEPVKPSLGTGHFAGAAREPLSPASPELEGWSGGDSARDPLITIGIPTRNRASLLMDCVASALAQSYRNIEVLVSDNASTDHTLEVLRSVDDPRLRVLENVENIGMVNNFGKCVREARGSYLVLAADDNILDPLFLEKCVRLIRQEPGLPIVVSAYQILVMNEFHENERRTVPAITSKKLSTGIWNGTTILREYLSGRLSAQLCSSAIRTDVLRRNGGYSTHPCAGDEATWIPALIEGRAGLVNERCATYLVHGSSESSSLSADSRFMDLCEVMDEISALATDRIPERDKRLQVQNLTSRYKAHQAMITLVLYRRAGASLTDAMRKLWDWRQKLARCTVSDFAATVRLRSLFRILLPAPLARWSIALRLDRLA